MTGNKDGTLLGEAPHGSASECKCACCKDAGEPYETLT